MPAGGPDGGVRVRRNELQRGSEVHGEDWDLRCQRSGEDGRALLHRRVFGMHNLLCFQRGPLKVGHHECDHHVRHVRDALAPEPSGH